MSTLKKLDRTQVEVFNSWKPHNFKRAPQRRRPDVRRTMSQLGPRPSDFIVAPDWVSEDADMTKAFGGRSHRPWNFEFPGARYWPRAGIPQPEVHSGWQNGGRAPEMKRHRQLPLDGANSNLATSASVDCASRPCTASVPKSDAALPMTSGIPRDNRKLTCPNTLPTGRPVNYYADNPPAGESCVQQTRYLPFLDALQAPNYSLSASSNGARNTAFSRHIAKGQLKLRHRGNYLSTAVRYSM